MILVDTSVVMDFLRLRDARFRETFVDNEAAICGITRAEVLHGARNEIDRRRLLSALDAFPHVPIPDELWDRVGTTLATLRAAGRKVPFPDAVIATVAMENDCDLWSRDSDHVAIRTIIPAPRLFPEPF